MLRSRLSSRLLRRGAAGRFASPLPAPPPNAGEDVRGSLPSPYPPPSRAAPSPDERAGFNPHAQPPPSTPRSPETSTARTAPFERVFPSAALRPPPPSLPAYAADLSSAAADTGLELARAASTADLMDEGKKSVLAALTTFHMDEGKMSHAAATSRALSDGEYVGYLQRCAEARHAAALLKVQYTALAKEVDLVRTFEATRRSEMNML